MTSTAELLDRIKKKKNQYSRSTAKTVKIKEGKTRVRFILADKMVNDEHPFGERDLGVHWIKLTKGGKPIAVVGCQEIVYGRPSVINPVIENAAKAAVDDETLEILKELKARKSVLINAVIRDGADASENPQILELTPSTFGDALSIYETYIEDGRTDVFDPKTGLDLIIERKGKNLDTEYTVMAAPSSKPLPASVGDKAVDIDEFIASEFFKGEEHKAINGISSIVGITPTEVPALASSRSTALLTSAKPVEPTKIDDTPRVAATATAAAAAAAVVVAAVESDEDRELREMEAKVAAAKLARQKKKLAEEAASKPVETKVAPKDEFGADLGDEDLDKMLSDLDGLADLA